MLDNMTYWIENADSALLLPTLPAASVDALVTDPPAGIGFMGKEWDGSKGGRDNWITWLAGILRECCRILKPGAYGWVWAIPRSGPSCYAWHGTCNAFVSCASSGNQSQAEKDT